MLVAYSGGADSTALLDLLAKQKYDIIAAHLNHGQRPEGALEEEQCARFCEQLGVPFVSGKADVPAIAEERGIGLEEAGRLARYEFFDRAASQVGTSWTATAHTADDCAETILLNLIRGAGLTGLTGIPEQRGALIRPLLPFTREETRSYCELHGLWFHDDPANFDLSFSRARIRHRVIPELQIVQPKLLQTIGRSAVMLGEEDRYLDSLAVAALERSEVEDNGRYTFLTQDEEIFIDRVALAAFPAVLVRRAIRLVAKTLGANPELALVDRVVDSVRLGACDTVNFGGGPVSLHLLESRIHATRTDAVDRERVVLPRGSWTSDPDGRWHVGVHPGPVVDPRTEPGSWTAHLDADRLVGGLFTRSGPEEAKMQPFGMAGHRKLSDILHDLKISLRARQRLPVVYDMVGPVWVPGGPIDERVKVLPETATMLTLEFGQPRAYHHS